MAKLTDKKIANIIQQEMPGYRLVNKQTDELALDSLRSKFAPAESVAPDIEELRRKFSTDANSSSTADSADVSSYAEDENNNDEVRIVAVEPESKTDAFDRSERPKVVIVSDKEGIIGYQG
jgi:hypothetical protein